MPLALRSEKALSRRQNTPKARRVSANAGFANALELLGVCRSIVKPFQVCMSRKDAFDEWNTSLFCRSSIALG
jgi:hypothetical protein